VSQYGGQFTIDFTIDLQ